jgi:Protein of unknown function (DUF4241)
MTTQWPQLEVAYCEQWDPERRAAREPLAVAVADRRHTAGEPYAVLLGAPDRPRLLIEVAAGQDELTCWCFDEQLRRTFMFEFRLLDLGWMTLLRMAEWQYADADRPEFDATSPRCLTTFGEGGVPVRRSFGEPEPAFRTLTEDERMVDVPRFGRWARLATFVLDAPEHRERHRIVQPAGRERPADPRRQAEPVPSEPAPPPAFPGEWAAVARRPGPEVTTMFGPAARYTLEPDDSGDTSEVVVEARPAGVLLMPTGRLVAADPGSLRDGVEPFSVTLPAGRHPVTLAVARFVEEPDHVRVAGCRVDVREEPVVHWEPALVPGQDPGTLDDGEFFAVGADAGMLCFFDAAALPGLVELSEVWDQPRGLWDELADAVMDNESAVLEDPETGTNLIAFSSGWGDGAYPVWLGRCADGQVACVVADTLVLSGATLSDGPR